ncbi:MAG: hypothetical protein K8F30_03855, partial [Taibaiella sp.]|nr:hypothetical protein [Taibaiella sp.]
MRVMLYFVAFGFLFAFAIPMLISTIVYDNEQLSWQLRQGVDPTTILEETAAGQAENNCEMEGYRYLITGDGYPYVKDQNGPYIAALINDRVVTFMVNETNNLAVPILEKRQIPDDAAKLSYMLSTCIESDKEPGITKLLLQN